jgi:hypothetical protein
MKSLTLAGLSIAFLFFWSMPKANAQTDCSLLVDYWGKAAICNSICMYGREFDSFLEYYALVLREGCKIKGYPSGLAGRVGPAMQDELNASIALHGGTNGYQVFCEKWRRFFAGLENAMRSSSD